MHSFKHFLVVPLSLFLNIVLAQNYQAIHGSSYAGSLGVGSNPASIVHVPYAWDITPFSVQFKQATNAVKIDKFSLLSSPSAAEVSAATGNKKRFVYANQDIRLLNTRINLNAKTAIAFGANIRNYVYANVSGANWQDTLQYFRDFLEINVGNLPFNGQSVGSTWGEVYASYAHTIIDDGDKLLNAGITLKVTRALAGGYAKAQSVNYSASTDVNTPGYMLLNGNLVYGYSSNFDNIKSGNSFKANRNIFLQKTYSGISADFGVEYILLTNEDKEEGGEFAYETKLGVSMLDVGMNKFRYGSQSRLALAGKTGITDTLLQDKFSSVTSFSSFNDSLAGIAGSFTNVSGPFHIYQPARVVINVDQHVLHNIFINAELIIPILPVVAKNSLYLKDMNLLAITPRWELKALGAYLPVLVNNQKQVWVGGAIKAGPILLGTHNLANIFAKNKTQNGGLYLALTIRPGKKYDRQGHYPKDKLPGKGKGSVECPKF